MIGGDVMFWRKRNATVETATEFTYAWRGQPRPGCPTAYIYIKRVERDRVETAMRRSDRARAFVWANLIRKDPPKSLKSHYAATGAIWNEILPSPERRPQRFPTHFLEVGLQNPGLPRSPFLSTALCLYIPSRDYDYADYCAIAIGGFLQWQIASWTKADFDGAALDVKPARQWILQCVFAKWKSLRAG